MPQVAFPIRARLARETVAAASVNGDDAEIFLAKVLAAVRRAVPHDAGGWFATDPGTLLWTGGVMHGLPLDVAVGLVANERAGDDLLAPSGIGDELRVAAAADGACFAHARLLRRTGAPRFTAQEATLLEQLSKDVARGLRLAMVRPGEAGTAVGAIVPGTAPGVLTVDDELRVVSATTEAHRWLAALAPAFGAHPLPPCVLSVVRRARALADGGADGPPRARVRTRCGTWVAVHASALTVVPRTWAVVIEPARAAEVLPLVARAHELTAREHEVFGLLLRGVPDKAIAQRLQISGHTAREHVRSVLRKLGVHSRGELQAMALDACAAEPSCALVAA